MYTAKTANVTIDLDVVRGIGEHELSPVAIEQRIIVDTITGIAAQQPVLSEYPEVAAAAHHNAGQRRNVIFRCIRISTFFAGLIQDDVDLGSLEAGEFDLNVEVNETL